MGDPKIATENVYGEDAEGKYRLLAAAGDPIPEPADDGDDDDAGKAKRKPADKAVSGTAEGK